MGFHYLFEAFFYRLEQLSTEARKLWLFVDDVVPHFRPGVIQDCLNLHLARKPAETRIFRQGGPIGLQLQDVVI